MMAKKQLLVMKFGGASLQTPAHFLFAAKKILEKKRDYAELVVVVSAMDDMTDKLLALARAVSSSPPRREQDMLLSVGERMSMALLAMALKERGVEAVSLTGSQSGIITCHRHTQARICHIQPDRIVEQLRLGKIVIVAGFQGMSRSREITTLGRGGSDTTAVALAAALGGRKVEFYKDVAGVYAEDPRKNPKAAFLPKLSYDEALKLARKGHFVLSLRAILLASKNQVPLHVLTFKRGREKLLPGTIITAKKSSATRRCVHDEENFATTHCAIYE